jgi:cobalt-zinc-cadmium efflux system outer membrane protein
MRLKGVKKHGVRGVVIAVLALSWAAPVVGQTQKGTTGHSKLLSIEEVIAATLEHHPSLKGEMQERLAADADLLSARGAFDPSIKGEGLSYATGGYTGNYGGAYVEQPLEFYGSKIVGGYRIGDGTFPIYDNYYETNSQGEAQFGVEVPLLRDGPIDRRRANIKRSEAGQTIADSMIELRRIELARAAAMTYWDWAAARNQVRVYKRLLDVAKERDRQIAERVKKGDLPEFDRTDNQRAVLQREAQFLSAERSVKNSEFNLGLFFRDADSRPVDVSSMRSPDRIPVPLFDSFASVDSSFEAALSARPEFKAIDGQRKQNELELTLARNQILPRLDLRVYSAKDFGTGDDKREEAELKGGLRVEIPLRTRTQEGRLDFFEARQRKLEFTETFLKERIRADVQDALNAVEVARKRVEVTVQEVVAAQDLAKGELQRFNLGDSNLIFVNLREQNAADAQVREIQALQDYQKACVAFEAAIARIQRERATSG